MKLITTQENLISVSGGSLGYDIFTKGAAGLGGAVGGLFGFAFAATGRSPGLCGILILPVVGVVMGSMTGYVGGAVTYTLINNLGSIVSAPFQVADFIFKPAK